MVTTLLDACMRIDELMVDKHHLVDCLFHMKGIATLLDEGRDAANAEVARLRMVLMAIEEHMMASSKEARRDPGSNAALRMIQEALSGVRSEETKVNSDLDGRIAIYREEFSK